MHILVLGAAGMVGRKLSERLLADGRLGKNDITRMTLQDVAKQALGTNDNTSIREVLTRLRLRPTSCTGDCGALAV